MIKRIRYIFLNYIIIAAILLCPNMLISGAEENRETAGVSSGSNTQSIKSTNRSYLQFYENETNKEMPVAEISVIENAQVLLKEGEFAEYSVTVGKAGLYGIKLTYKALKGRGANPAFKLTLNGEIPYSEAASIQLMRRWRDEVPHDGGVRRFETLEQIEEFEYQTTFINDNVNFYGGRLYFALKEGTNTLCLVMESESIEIRDLAFCNEPETPLYEQASKNFTAAEYDGEPVYIEAENAIYKSSATLYAINDKTSATTSPTSAYEKYLNTIGGNAWSAPGQYIEWDIDVPKTGLYEIAVKYRQNTNVGTICYRRILIDGKVVYNELDQTAFPYTNSFKNNILGEEDIPYLFELTEGNHILRMEVVIGEMANILPEVNQIISTLNTAYRKIIMITGTSPDTLRDYRLDRAIPEVLESMKLQRKNLDRLIRYFAEKMQGGSGVTKIFDTLSRQLKEFEKDSYYITSKLGQFKSNISSISSWLVDAKKQPIQIDYFVLYAPQSKIKRADPTFFQTLKFEILSLLHTFSADYYTNKKDVDAVNVWVPTGASQASIIQQMIESDFATNSNIPINLKLVNNSLLMAIVSGRGPDVALGVGTDDAMNFAFRDAVVDLSGFPDIQEITKRFRPSAMIPISYKEKIYGLPEAQSFYVLFYRKDVLDELGIKIPDTWEQVISAMAALKKNNLEFGIPTALQSYYSILYQNGGSVYNKDATATALTSLEAINTFTKWSSYFTDYKSPRTYDAQNRFRTGEMPLLIDNFVLHDTLSVLAPEIQGLWGMALLPGTVQKDGAIDRSVCSSVTSSIVLNEEKKDDCWEFVKWWTSDSVQAKYAQRIELALGQSARHETANINAFQTLAYPKDRAEKLYEQAEWTIGIPSVPGGYYTSRHVSNALNKVLYNSEVPGEALIHFSRIIDEEIKYKREELKLN